jgi:hypothetical protein
MKDLIAKYPHEVYYLAQEFHHLFPSGIVRLSPLMALSTSLALDCLVSCVCGCPNTIHTDDSKSSDDSAMSEDLGSVVDIANWLLVGVSGLFMGLRLYCKTIQHRGIWWDDHILIASWVRSILHQIARAPRDICAGINEKLLIVRLIPRNLIDSVTN